MRIMKRQGPGRVLTFAVTGALLGSMGGCATRPPGGKYVNPGPTEPPQPAVNPGPTDVGETPTQPEPAEPDHVNEGPVDEPPAEQPPSPTAKPPIMVNTVKTPEPEPAPEPPTTNVRKVEEPPRKRR